MSFPVRVVTILWGLLLIFLGLDLAWTGGEDFQLAALIIAAAVMVSGIRRIAYFFTLARYMVGGWVSLVTGLLRFGFGGFMVFYGTQSTTYFAAFFLLIWFIVSGIKDLLSAVEKRSVGQKRWWLGIISGLAIIALALYTGWTLDEDVFIVNLFSVYLFGSGFSKIASAVRSPKEYTLDGQ